MWDLDIDPADPIETWREGADVCAEPADLIRVWLAGPFRLELWDTFQTDRLGKPRLAYRLFDSRMGAEPIFDAADFFVSPLHAIDSDAAVAGVLGFLSLQSGDTDAEYFDDYTDRQAEWRDLYADELSCHVFDLEESDR